tara:strand:+ start:3202 stop:3387 length:186 start_codon:yes stop_codon:yes gene_type:complete
MEIRDLIIMFFTGSEEDLPPNLRQLKKEYLREIQGGGCSGCQARRVRAKYEALIIQRSNQT